MGQSRTFPPLNGGLHIVMGTPAVGHGARVPSRAGRRHTRRPFIGPGGAISELGGKSDVTVQGGNSMLGRRDRVRNVGGVMRMSRGFNGVISRWARGEGG
ncbi:hypothetical protein EUGRSUZ_F00496 [Eucalyptus grandis]|uniref:Uncharacterized protein n=2 Tax=Eucalyptus grandis TaxID=71139 RepID=A0ACC3KAZ8_EUCGR|nr:hypothetical protein EUGRSUZ_F00496 [Eucalyptus grandis]